MVARPQSGETGGATVRGYGTDGAAVPDEAIGALASVVVASADYPWLSTILLGTLLSFLIGLVWQTLGRHRTQQTSLLETPFYLAHDAEVFDRYRRLAQEMLRISGRPGQIFRNCALESLDASIAQISVVGDGNQPPFL